MDSGKNVAIMTCNAKFFSVSDGNMHKVGSSIKKMLWMPACLAALGFAERRARPLASAGMTTGVGGASH
jgi:hypothetical protein